MANDDSSPVEEPEIIQKLLRYIESGVGLEELVEMIRAPSDDPNRREGSPMLGIDLSHPGISPLQRQRLEFLLASLGEDPSAPT